MPSAAKYTKENVVSRLSPKNEVSRSESPSCDSKRSDTTPTIGQKLKNQYQSYQAEGDSLTNSEPRSRQKQPLSPAVTKPHVNNDISVHLKTRTIIMSGNSKC